LQLNDVKVTAQNDISANLVLVNMSLGDFTLDANLLDIRAQILISNPTVSLQNGRFHARVSAQTSQGTGRAHLRFQWQGKGLSRTLCGDVDVARNVDGELAPVATTLTASASLMVKNGEFVLVPDVPRPRIRLIIEPSQASWNTVREALAAQGGLCGSVLQKVDVVSKLRDFLAK